MILNNLKIINFRNYINSTFNFNKNLNIIFGENGSGKTSILEAIHYLTLSKSFKTKYDRTALNKDSNYFQIFGEFIGEDNKKINVNVNYENNIGKKILLDKNPLEKKTDIIGKIPVVILSPTNNDITLGNPSIRRNFINRIISQVDKKYFQALIDYSKRLTDRNILLNDYKNKNNTYDQYFEVQDELLVKSAKIIYEKRIQFLEKFEKIFIKKFENITHLNFAPKIKINYNIKSEMVNLETVFIDKLKKRFNKDLLLTRTTCGPHLDNVIFYIDEHELREIGSQGENKVFLVALKMAEADYIEKNITKKVIFLLDDLFALLDGKHCTRIVKEISMTNQTFVTTTDISELKKYNLEIENSSTLLIDLSSGVS